jgi:hypothetical protein
MQAFQADYRRWSHNSSCLTEPAIYPPEVCKRIAEMLPACEDALDIALEDSTVSTRVAAREACVLPEEVRLGNVLANGADRRKPKVNCGLCLGVVGPSTD